VGRQWQSLCLWATGQYSRWWRYPVHPSRVSGHDSAVVRASVSVQRTTSFSTYISYEGELGCDRNQHSPLCQFLLISFYVYCKYRIFALSKIFARSASATFPLRCGLGLLLCSVLQFVAWQFDIGWVRRLLPPFLAIVPWSVVGFFLMSLIVIFLLWRSGPVQPDSKLRPRSWERSSGGHFPDSSWNTSFKLPVTTLDTLLFKQLILQVHTSVPRRWIFGRLKWMV
jgi:hypothetical protein